MDIKTIVERYQGYAFASGLLTVMLSNCDELISPEIRADNLICKLMRLYEINFDANKIDPQILDYDDTALFFMDIEIAALKSAGFCKEADDGVHIDVSPLLYLLGVEG